MNPVALKTMCPSLIAYDVKKQSAQTGIIVRAQAMVTKPNCALGKPLGRHPMYGFHEHEGFLLRSIIQPED